MVVAQLLQLGSQGGSCYWSNVLMSALLMALMTLLSGCSVKEMVAGLLVDL